MNEILLAFVTLRRNHILAERFELRQPVGRGGQGDVWLATDLTTGLPVAVKLMLVGANPRAHARFEQEAAILLQLEHPSIARALAFGDSEDGLFLVLEYIDGRDLGALMRSRESAGSPFSAAELLRLFSQICSAVAYAHSRGIVHRDLKPSNILIPSEETLEIKIIDFGIARVESDESDATTAGRMMGTPSYMAPEQIRGERIQAQTDVFALGTLLFEVATFHRAWIRDPSDRPIRSSERVRGSNPMPVILSGARPLVSDFRPEWNVLDGILGKTFAVAPPDRPSVTELFVLLQTALHPEGKPTNVGSEQTPSSVDWEGPNRAPLALVASVALAAVAFLLWRDAEDPVPTELVPVESVEAVDLPPPVPAPPPPMAHPTSPESKVTAKSLLEAARRAPNDQAKLWRATRAIIDETAAMPDSSLRLRTQHEAMNAASEGNVELLESLLASTDAHAVTASVAVTASTAQVP